MEIFNKSGAYLNDCPLCRTHNSLIEVYFGGSFRTVFECRDCESVFDHGDPGTIVLIKRKSRKKK